MVFAVAVVGIVVLGIFAGVIVDYTDVRAAARPRPGDTIVTAVFYVRAASFTDWRRYRAGKQSTVGIVPPYGSSRLPVPIPPGRRRIRVVAQVGEADGRLRVISVRAATRRPGATIRLANIALGDLFRWLM